LFEEAKTRLELLEDVGGHLPVACIEAVRSDLCPSVAHRGGGDLGDGFRLNSDRARLRLQALPAAGRARRLAEEGRKRVLELLVLPELVEQLQEAARFSGSAQRRLLLAGRECGEWPVERQAKGTEHRQRLL